LLKLVKFQQHPQHLCQSSGTFRNLNHFCDNLRKCLVVPQSAAH